MIENTQISLPNALEIATGFAIRVRSMSLVERFRELFSAQLMSLTRVFQSGEVVRRREKKRSHSETRGENIEKTA